MGTKAGGIHRSAELHREFQARQPELRNRETLSEKAKNKFSGKALTQAGVLGLWVNPGTTEQTEASTPSLKPSRDPGFVLPQDYLHSLGKARTAQVQKDARIGEAEAKRDAGIRVREMGLLGLRWLVRHPVDKGTRGFGGSSWVTGGDSRDIWRRAGPYPLAFLVNLT